MDFLYNAEFARNVTLVVTAFITGVLSPVVASWASEKVSRKKVVIEEEETDEILKLLHANEMIDQRIENIRSEYDFDRVWIAQFHNGGSFYPSDKTHKFQKFSLTYEACRPGISSELSVIQNVPVSVFASILRKVKEDGQYGVHNTATVQDNSSTLKAFWNDRGVKGFHIFAIKSLNKKFLGFMVVDCMNTCDNMTEEIVENLVVESKILGGYLAKEDVDYSK
jgi:hypothetical protein